ncbi:transposase [Tolypothrix sp. NIES-4075]|uniref:transposase n=1 Tax=Tolypothrix sp. NIES-4075 TaxID=2005459 RepID=UPI001F179CE1|nr:transposase [Tolypothrix sp. NIES-4075]
MSGRLKNKRSLRRKDSSTGSLERLMGLFPPGKGGGEEVAYGGKGKGVLIHTLTEGNGMPLSNSTTPANGNEREEVLPLLDKVKLKTLKRGRPRKRLKVLAADKGYDSKEQRTKLRKRGIRPQIPKRNWKTKKNTRLTDTSC